MKEHRRVLPFLECSRNCKLIDMTESRSVVAWGWCRAGGEGDQMKMEMHEEAFGVFAPLNTVVISWV